MTKKNKAITSIVFVLYLFWGVELTIGAEEEPTKTEETAAEETQPKEEKGKEPEAEEEAPVEENTKESVKEEIEAAVARPVSSDPVQIYGWREWVRISDGKNELKMAAKLDTGALTSSIHVDEKKLFERDGKKWVRFVVTNPRAEDEKRLRIEAPLVRIARIKEPGGESEPREVVRLSFKIGDRKLPAEFTLNNRDNMLSPVLIGRRTITELGWVDSSRAYLADKKVMR